MREVNSPCPEMLGILANIPILACILDWTDAYVDTQLVDEYLIAYDHTRFSLKVRLSENGLP